MKSPSNRVGAPAMPSRGVPSLECDRPTPKEPGPPPAEVGAWPHDRVLHGSWALPTTATRGPGGRGVGFRPILDGARCNRKSDFTYPTLTEPVNAPVAGADLRASGFRDGRRKSTFPGAGRSLRPRMPAQDIPTSATPTGWSSGTSVRSRGPFQPDHVGRFTNPMSAATAPSRSGSRSLRSE